eukprot:TRINITY_DN10052_c0_g2_i1.p1 TRINITY_DN10052_c0_g2~~TRINITY_DN10052_c0_g2_i1.p1  ORF type:complete len:753 (-),score=233.86 TRINITY_DN10052_c0_g2_i1:391-2649(-)
MMSADAFATYGSYANNYFCGYNSYGTPAQPQMYANANYQMQGQGQGWSEFKPSMVKQSTAAYGDASNTPSTRTSAASGGTQYFNLADFSDNEDSADETRSQNKANSPSNGSTRSSRGSGSSSEECSSASEDSSDDDSKGFSDGESKQNEKELWKRKQALFAALERAKAWCEPEDQSKGNTMSLHDLLRWRGQAHAWPKHATSYTSETVKEPQPQAAKSAAPKMKPSKLPTARKQTAKQTAKKTVPSQARPGPAVNEPPAALKVSGNSWAAQQKARREQKSSADDTDEQVGRKIKGVLNKLTLEKFEQLTEKLLTSGITTAAHVKILIQELFEKAITQHHFIDMYADLCVLLNQHFSYMCLNTDDPKFSFKRSLLEACQMSFERHLAPPAGLGEMDPEERCIAETRYKLCMIGNIRFIGAILTRKMLSSQVMVGIIEELLGNPTPEALECLAALLTVIGGTFDCQGSPQRPMLNHIFDRISSIIKNRSCQPRERCLLQDVLDLRAAGWKDQRPKKMERPTTLDEVAQQKAAEEDQNNLASLRASRNAPKKQPYSSGQQQQQQQPHQQKLQQMLLKQQLEKLAHLKEEQEKEDEKKNTFDQEVFRSETRKAFLELRYSKDVEEATARLAALSPPPADQQVQEITELLSSVSEESSADARSNGFKVLASLFDSKALTQASAVAAGSIASAIAPWRTEYFGDALKTFVEDICPDLCCDVPSLPKILAEELHPVLVNLTQNGILEAEKIKVVAGFKA